MPPPMLHLLIFSLFISHFFSPFARAALANITVDDTDDQITYAPASAWQAGQSCQNCTAKPDANQAYDGTWHDASYNPPGGLSNSVPGQIVSASMDFTGTAVYIFCILTGSSSSPNGNTDMTFFLDNQEVGSFTRPSDGDKSYQYNQIVFSWTGLDGNTGHNVRLESGHAGQRALVMLDRIVYTTDDSVISVPTTPSTTTSSPSSQQSTTTTSSSSDSSLEETSSSQSSTSDSSQVSTSVSNSGLVFTPAHSILTSSDSRQTVLPSLSIPDSSSSGSSNSDSSDSGSSNTGTIVGATLGGLGGLCLFVGMWWICARRRKVRDEDEVAQVIQPFFTRSAYGGGPPGGVGSGGSAVGGRGSDLVGGGLAMDEGSRHPYLSLSALGNAHGVPGGGTRGSRTLMGTSTSSPTTLETPHTPVSLPLSRGMYGTAMPVPNPAAESDPSPNQHRYAINVRSEKMRQQLQAQRAQAQNHAAQNVGRGPQTAKRAALSPFSPTPLYSPTQDRNDVASPSSASTTFSGAESSSPEGYTANMRERLERIRRWYSTGRSNGFGIDGGTSAGEGIGTGSWDDGLKDMNGSLEPVAPHALLRPNRRREPPLLDDQPAAPRPNPPPRPHRSRARPLTRILEITQSGHAENDATEVPGTVTATVRGEEGQSRRENLASVDVDANTSATLSATANADAQSDEGSEVRWQRKLVDFFTTSNSSSPVDEGKRGMRGSRRTLPIPPGAPPPGAIVYTPASKEQRAATTPPPPYQSKSGRS